MQSVNIVRESEVVKTPRVLQLSGMFDIPPMDRSSESWRVSLPLDERGWSIGLIVGPSGCGKTTVARELFAGCIFDDFAWDEKKSILDGFPEDMGIKQITEIINSVGFSSPPSWFRPYHVLSNGEKFRVTIARALAEALDMIVIDEFTSVVDRTVAKIGSHAVAKTVRQLGKKFVAVTCHYDIEEWLQPDWVYKPAENEFQWRFLQRRPNIQLTIRKVHHSAWEYFKRHHYLTADMHKGAQSFVAFIDQTPVAFMSFIHFQNNRLKRTKKGHRIVVLPDYQGVGIGTKMVEHVAGCLAALGFDFIGRTAHPSMNAYRSRSEKWRCIRKPEISLNRGRRGKQKSVMHVGRLVSTYRYVGEKQDIKKAKELLLC